MIRALPNRSVLVCGRLGWAYVRGTWEQQGPGFAHHGFQGVHMGPKPLAGQKLDYSQLLHCSAAPVHTWCRTSLLYPKGVPGCTVHVVSAQYVHIIGGL